MKAKIQIGVTEEGNVYMERKVRSEVHVVQKNKKGEWFYYLLKKKMGRWEVLVSKAIESFDVGVKLVSIFN